RAALGYSVYRARSQIQTQEQLVEQRIVTAGASGLQSVEEWVVIEHIRGVQIEPAEQPSAFGADVAHVEREFAGDFPSDREREVLDVRSVEVRIERMRALAQLGQRDRLHRQCRRRERNLLLQRRHVEIAAVHRPRRSHVTEKAGCCEDEVRKVARMAASGVADLIAAADVRFSFSKPWQFPGEADSRSEIVVVIWEN